jgi:hypothetical protein
MGAMVKMREVRRIAWAIYWRTSLASVIIGFLAGGIWGFIVGFSATIAGIPKETWQPISMWGGATLGFVATLLSFNYFLAWSIGRTFGQRRLELVDTTITVGGQ